MVVLLGALGGGSQEQRGLLHNVPQGHTDRLKGAQEMQMSVPKMNYKL